MTNKAMATASTQKGFQLTISIDRAELTLNQGYT